MIRKWDWMRRRQIDYKDELTVDEILTRHLSAATIVSLLQYTELTYTHSQRQLFTFGVKPSFRMPILAGLNFQHFFRLFIYYDHGR